MHFHCPNCRVVSLHTTRRCYPCGNINAEFSAAPAPSYSAACEAFLASCGGKVDFFGRPDCSHYDITGCNTPACEYHPRCYPADAD